MRRNGTVDPTDTVVPELRFEIHQNNLPKGDAALLNIIAANHWKRPIYFTADEDNLGFGKYLRQDGLTYRLVPVENQPLHQDWMTNKLLNTFSFGNAQIPGVYFDEENRFHLLTLRQTYTTLAVSLIATGRKADARKVLEKCDRGMNGQNMPYGLCSRYGNRHNRISAAFAAAAAQAGDTALAQKVDNAVLLDCQQQVAYYEALPDRFRVHGSFLEYEYQTAKKLIGQIKNASPGAIPGE